ncbi:FAD-dependent oxidoreductase [Planctomycetota bacterium]
MIRAEINGRPVTVEPGTTILQAAQSIGIEIPTLCFLKELEPSMSCFVCIVRIEGKANFMPSCATLIEEWMKVTTDSEEVIEARKTALELLLSDHVGDCIAPCQSACPAHIDIPKFIAHIKNGENREAIRLIRKKVAFSAVLGRICPEICEKVCRRKDLDAPVAICHLKRFPADEDLKDDSPDIPECSESSGKKVAVIGAGVAGLSAAFYLMIKGYTCTVFDKNPEPGGAVRYSISEERLPHSVLDGEIGIIKAMGCKFRMFQEWGSDFRLRDLKNEYDAVFIACGNMKNKDLVVQEGLEQNKNGIKADSHTFETSMQSVFAGGACAHPARAAVQAVAAGRRAAVSIDQFLRGEAIAGEHREFTVRMHNLDETELEKFAAHADLSPRSIESVGKGENPGEERKGFTQEEAIQEAERCLECECIKVDTCRLRFKSDDYSAKPAQYRGSRRKFERDITHPDIVYETGKCIMCGICTKIAEQYKEELGLSFIGRGFTVKLKVPFDKTVEQGLSEAARKCAELCPTGAISFKRT